MRTRCLILALAVGLLPGLTALPLAAGDKPDAGQVARWIDRLGSARYVERERASKALEAVGVPALAALRKAARSADLEVRRRAEVLVDRIEKQAEAAAVLAPTRVRLAVKDRAVPDVVAEMARLSKCDVQVHPNVRARLANRKLTLDTGDVTFWEALDQLCDKAGLVPLAMNVQMINPYNTYGIQPAIMPVPAPIRIRPPRRIRIRPAPAVPQRIRGAAPLQFQLPAQPVKGFPQALPVIPPNVNLTGYAIPAAMPANDQVMLTEGKPEKLPTCYCGAFRVRLRTLAVNPADAASDVLTTFEVTSEPRVKGWLLAGDPRIDQARDEHGEALTLAWADGQDRLAAQREVVLRTYYNPYQAVASNQQNAQVRLRRGSSSRTIKSLKGTLAVQAPTPPMPLITVDEVLKAAGRTVKGVRGGWIKVLDAGKDAQGNYRVRFKMEAPPGVHSAASPFGDVIIGGNGRIRMVVQQIQIQGAMIQVNQPAAAGGSETLTLVDGQGKPFTLAGASYNTTNGVAERTLVFRPRQGQGEPARLVYTARRNVTAVVPFAFADVKTAR